MHVGEREFLPEGPEGALRLTFEDLDVKKLLNLEKVTIDVPELLPQWLQDLKGRRVRLRGYMLPNSVFQETGNKRFVLASEKYGVMNFGAPPAIDRLVEIGLREGHTVDYAARPFDMEGDLGIEAEELDGVVYRLYQLHDAVIIETPVKQK